MVVTAQDRIDGTGEAFSLSHQQMTFVNFFRVSVPSALFTPSQADLDLIRRVGPMTQSYAPVYSYLAPARVAAAHAQAQAQALF